MHPLSESARLHCGHTSLMHIQYGRGDPEPIPQCPKRHDRRYDPLIPAGLHRESSPSPHINLRLIGFESIVLLLLSMDPQDAQAIATHAFPVVSHLMFLGPNLTLDRVTFLNMPYRMLELSAYVVS